MTLEHLHWMTARCGKYWLKTTFRARVSLCTTRLHFNIETLQQRIRRESPVSAERRLSSGAAK